MLFSLYRTFNRFFNRNVRGREEKNLNHVFFPVREREISLLFSLGILDGKKHKSCYFPSAGKGKNNVIFPRLFGGKKTRNKFFSLGRKKTLYKYKPFSFPRSARPVTGKRSRALACARLLLSLTVTKVGFQFHNERRFAMSKKAINPKLECAKKMPELRHKVGNEYDVSESEVVRWLITQPDILQFIFEAVRRKGYAEPLIVYNPERGTWKGVDYAN